MYLSTNEQRFWRSEKIAINCMRKTAAFGQQRTVNFPPSPTISHEVPKSQKPMVIKFTNIVHFRWVTHTGLFEEKQAVILLIHIYNAYKHIISHSRDI